jgi:hypothetical protein
MSGWGGGNEWTGPAPSVDRQIANLRQSNDKLREALREYEGKKHTSFWRGLVIGASMTPLIIIALSAAAFGETIQIGGIYINGQSASSTTTVTIEPSDQPGELAVVTFVNEYVNNGSNNGTYPLSMGDLLTVEARFTWEEDPVTGADRIDLIVPMGVTCDPEDCGVTVEEGFSGQIILFQWQGM